MSTAMTRPNTWLHPIKSSEYQETPCHAGAVHTRPSRPAPTARIPVGCRCNPGQRPASERTLASRGPRCGWRSGKCFLTGRMLFKGRHAGEFRSDRLGRLGSDAFEPLDPARDRPELVDGPNVLSPQHVPGVGRQAKTLDWAWAGFVMATHLACLLACWGEGHTVSCPMMAMAAWGPSRLAHRSTCPERL
jgi:hypothetical protein